METVWQYLAEHAAVLSMMAAYLLICLGIGWYFKQKASSGLKAYYIAKREIPGWVVSLAFFSTFASTNTYIGQAGQAFEYGLSWAWVGLFWAIFCVISWLVLGPRMRNQTAQLGSCDHPRLFPFSLPEFPVSLHPHPIGVYHPVCNDVVHGRHRQGPGTRTYIRD